jgi:hypothetical protein
MLKSIYFIVFFAFLNLWRFYIFKWRRCALELLRQVEHYVVVTCSSSLYRSLTTLNYNDVDITYCSSNLKTSEVDLRSDMDVCPLSCS